MGPAAVGPGSVRVTVPTRRRGPQPCCSRGAATCDSSEGPNVPDHHRERSFVRRPVKEVQKGPDAVSSNLSDDDGGWSGRKATSSQTVATRWPTAGTPSQTLGRRPRTCGKRNMTDVSARAGRRPRAPTGAVRDRRRTEASRAARVDARQERGAEGQIRPSDRERRDEAAQRRLDDGGPTLLALAFAPARRLDSMTPTRTTTSSP